MNNINNDHVISVPKELEPQRCSPNQQPATEGGVVGPTSCECDSIMEEDIMEYVTKENFATLLRLIQPADKVV